MQRCGTVHTPHLPGPLAIPPKVSGDPGALGLASQERLGCPTPPAPVRTPGGHSLVLDLKVEVPAEPVNEE
jgi:hypothetical protein